MTPDILTIWSVDGTRLRAYRWGASGPDILLVPGQGEHGRRYDHVGDFLATSGYRLTVLELRGHGHSEGLQGHVRRWEDYHEDIHATVRQLATPYVLMGHSMGGLAVLDYLRRHLVPEPVAVLLSNPLVGLAFEPAAAKVIAANVLDGVFPEFLLPTDLDTSKLSRDREMVRLYDTDPWIGHRVSVHWYTQMMAAAQRVRSGGQFHLPMLMLIGTADGITSPAVNGKLFDSWAGPKARHVYQRLYHELFNEPEKYDILEDVRIWLNAIFHELAPAPKRRKARPKPQ